VTKSFLSPRKLFPIFIAIIVLTLIALACGTSAPAPSAEEPVAGVPTQSSQADVPGAATSMPAIPEKRRLTLELPSKIRVGDSDVIRLTLEVDDLGNITPTAQVEGNIVQGGVIEIPNLYETHYVIAQAEFDIAGLQVSPPDRVSQVLEQGQTVNFYWSVRPEETGIYRGTIWLYLEFEDKSSREKSQKTVSTQLVEIEAVDFFGFSINFARGTGVVGSVVGGIVGFPFFQDIVKFLFGRFRKRRR